MNVQLCVQFFIGPVFGRHFIQERWRLLSNAS